MEPSPPYPSVSVHTMINGDDAEGSLSPDDTMLSYISRTLMVDDIDDKLLCEYSDHPALLQAQQVFAQTLSCPSFGSNGDNIIHKHDMDGIKNLLQGPSGQTTPSLSVSKGADVAREFLKGMEEASKFLPSDDYFMKGDNMSQMFNEHRNCFGFNKRYNPEYKVGKSTEGMMVTGKPVEKGSHEMFDEIMLHGHDTCIRDMEKLRIAMDDEAQKNRKGASKEKRYVVDLHTLLIRCAQAVDANDYMGASELLKQIKQHASAMGDATQRLAQCFLKGLEARLAGMGSQVWQLLMAERPSVTEFLKAYKLYMAACCFNKVTLVFNFMTILPVMTGRNKLHIVDYGPHHGFHWSSFLRLLANRVDSLPEVKITAIGHPQLRCFPVERIEETGHRLGKCALEFGFPSFKFHVITERWEAVSIENLNVDADEVLVVNELFNFNTLMDETIYFGNQCPRDTVLNNIRNMHPDIFIQGIVNCSHGTSFMTRFREVLLYYSTMFDALEATMPRESEQRLVVERDILGPHALNVIACEGRDRVNRSNTYKQWGLRNQRAGLCQLALDPYIVSTVRAVVKEHQYHKDFLIDQDHQWLLQGWKGRILYAHSTWVADKKHA